jgi:hypothetical protein
MTGNQNKHHTKTENQTTLHKNGNKTTPNKTITKKITQTTTKNI